MTYFAWRDLCTRGYTMPSQARFAVVRKMLEERGYSFVRSRGSHFTFDRPGGPLVVVPVRHGKVKYDYVRKIKKIKP